MTTNILFFFPIPSFHTGLNRYASTLNLSNVDIIIKSSSQSLPSDFSGSVWNLPFNLYPSVDRGIFACLTRLFLYFSYVIFILLRFFPSNKPLSFYNLIPESCLIPLVNYNVVCHDLTFSSNNKPYYFYCLFSLFLSHKVFCISRSTFNQLSSMKILLARINTILAPNDCTYISKSFSYARSAFKGNHSSYNHLQILYVASYLPHKNHSFLLSSLSSLFKSSLYESYSVTITLVGRNVDELGYFMDFPYNVSIQYYTNLSDSCLSRLYRISDLYVCPSLSEGFNYPIFEAAYHDLPLILSSIPCHIDLSPPNDLLFDPYDPASLKNAIKCFLINRSSSIYTWKPNFSFTSIFDIK